MSQRAVALPVQPMEDAARTLTRFRLRYVPQINIRDVACVNLLQARTSQRVNPSPVPPTTRKQDTRCP